MHLFTPEKLKHQLASWPQPGCYWVAFSGGVDSTALLHAMARIRGELTAEVKAIHINHGLHPDADSWQDHCGHQCKKLGIPLVCETVQLERVARQSPEALARTARYAAIKAKMQNDDMLLTAHHADDQAETLILNLMRGAGVDGLAAIQPVRRLGRVWLARPLLEWRRDQLSKFLAGEDIRFIEDPSNEDLSIRRNYVRHEILPRLAEMWPAAIDRLNKSAELARSASSILKNLAEADLAQCLGLQVYEINLDRFSEFDTNRQALIVREWCRSNKLPTPNQQQLNELIRQLQDSREDSAVCLKWPGVELHRYRSMLFIMAALPDYPQGWQLDWDGLNPADLPGGCGNISLHCDQLAAFTDPPLRLHVRSGSEQLHPVGQAHHKTLKQLFQSAGIPPWLRSRIPLVSRNGQCLAVGDIWLDQQFAELLSESGSSMQWQPGIQQWRDMRRHILAAN